MRILVMFDLPVGTDSERRNYRLFRKYLVKNGFLMLQESVYCKIAQNSTAAETIVENVKKNKPPVGLVQVLKVTEKQYSRMEYIVGETKSEVIDNDDFLFSISNIFRILYVASEPYKCDSFQICRQLAGNQHQLRRWGSLSGNTCSSDR